ncbi:hypothetical protein LEP1GSC150_1525 [Leptospira interrogans serovar Copenhageni str. LT2050]|uniref:DUF6968 domain-containing protein n=1 Tax=Leptospira interrogans serovar Copenhageni str. LT2050 TaxID=1001598 RepID=M3GC00_LEPIT|nr:hypothetical protein LEP1GSC150_1525 [Leptospira interrogans serovar Copenhageni str. LT2050]
MKNTYRLGTIIAEREILFQVGKKKSEIHIKIGKPKLHPDPVIRWYCPLQIIGIGSEKAHGAFGSDSIRAIEMAFQMAGLLLVRDIQKLYNLNWLKPGTFILSASQ